MEGGSNTKHLFRARKPKKTYNTYTLYPFSETQLFESTIYSLLTSRDILKYSKRTEPFTEEEAKKLLSKWKNNSISQPVWQVVSHNTFVGLIFMNFNQINNEIQVCYYKAPQFENTLVIYEALGRLGNSLYKEKNEWNLKENSFISYKAKTGNQEIQLLNCIFYPQKINENPKEIHWKIPLQSFETEQCKY